MMPKHTLDLKDHDALDQRREKLENFLIIISLAVTGVATVFDLIADVNQGSSILHLLDEVLITTLIFVSLIFIWRRTLNLQRDIQTQRRLTHQAQSAQTQAEAEAKRWRQEASKAIQGLSDAIDMQLTRWQLTPAEKEVALLLLKGLSLKDVAEVRGVSEKTARAQSFTIYSKSGLSGRAELSAFFLEDLMTPLNL